MSLWRWAVDAWERPGFAAAGMRLQDDSGQCVPLLMWGVWLAERGRAPDDDAIETAVLFARKAMTTIQPLRDARRAAAPARRGALLHQELKEERALMDLMETIAVSKAKPVVEPATTLAAIAARWGSPVDSAVFLGLLEEPADVG